MDNSDLVVNPQNRAFAHLMSMHRTDWLCVRGGHLITGRVFERPFDGLMLVGIYGAVGWYRWDIDDPSFGRMVQSMGGPG